MDYNLLKVCFLGYFERVIVLYNPLKVHLDRNDHTINLFEIKFHNKPYPFSKADADKLRHTMWAFQEGTPTNKQVSWVFLAAFGLAQNQYSLGLISHVLTLDDLF